jgi:hypothetical protein
MLPLSQNWAHMAASHSRVFKQMQIELGEWKFAELNGSMLNTPEGETEFASQRGCDCQMKFGGPVYFVWEGWVRPYSLWVEENLLGELNLSQNFPMATSYYSESGNLDCTTMIAIGE